MPGDESHAGREHPIKAAHGPSGFSHTLGEIDPATIENEYRDAKKRYRAQVKAVKDWEKRAGLEDLCTSLEQARSELNTAEEALTTVVPESIADASAITKVVRQSLTQFGELEDWEKAAFNNASKFWNARPRPFTLRSRSQA